MAKDKFTKPIAGSAQTVNFTTTVQTWADLGVTPDSTMRKLIFDVDGDPLAPEIVGRYWEDGTDPTAAEGFPLQSGERVELTLEQFNGFKVRTVSAPVAINLTQYAEEV